MMLTRWQRPHRDWLSLGNYLMRAFDRDYYRDEDDQSLTSPTWNPTTDIYETKDEYVLKVELPGISKDDVKIEFENGTLTISGERKEEKEVKQENYHRLESFCGVFSRSFTIPKGVNDQKIAALMKEGILELRLPKAEETKPKAIPINVK